ncbi:MAG: hypothetical protein NDJ90_14630 [Oligoflexia bacterium]|nr:hypothetical protein [Oligoflexia bacterium]
MRLKTAKKCGPGLRASANYARAHALTRCALTRGLVLALALGIALATTLTGCSALPRGFGDEFGLSPFENWKQLETKHFRLTFPEELGEVAARSAEYFEEAHTLLAPRLHWEPRHKVSIILVDNTDSSNGLTTPLGRFGIVLMVTPPENWYSTYYHDDWLRLLAIHEYAHYLNMDPSDGLYSILRVVFGDVILPNGLWPSWMTEGLAVYLETRFTSAGRGRSPYYEMILRAAVEENALDEHRFVTLDRVNGSNPYFPQGETPYLFGYQLMNQVAREHEDALGMLSRDSSAALPYFVNTRIGKLTGKQWYAYWSEWVEETRARSAKDLDAIRAKPLTSAQRLTHGGGLTLGAAFSPDGRWIAFPRHSPDQNLSLQLLDRESGLSRTLSTTVAGATLAFTPDSRTVIYGNLRRKGTYTSYNDLAAYDLERNSWRWLSNGLRARDPDVSRDGRWVAFAHSAKASTGISLAPLEKDDDGHYRLGEIRRLYVPALYDAAHTPRFSPDGKTLYFTLHRNGKTSEALMSLNIESGEIAELVNDSKFNRFPAVHPDGTLYFVSDRSGVENIYQWNAAKRSSQPVTNVTTGLSFPSFDPTGKLHANLFSVAGWDLAFLETAQPPAEMEPPAVSAPPAPEPFEIAKPLEGGPLRIRLIQVPQLPELPKALTLPEFTSETRDSPQERSPDEAVLADTALPPPEPADGSSPHDPASAEPTPGESTPGEPAPALPATQEPPAALPDIRRYSPWNSLLPRQWFPYVASNASGGTTLGAMLEGFDTLELHRYSAAAFHDSFLGTIDWNASYSNRTLGPTLSLQGSNETDRYYILSSQNLGYVRRATASLEVSYPFQYTASTFLPAVAFNLERSILIDAGPTGTGDEIIARTALIPSMDFAALYSSASRPALGVSPETGRTLVAGSRLYLGLDRPLWKFLAKGTQYVNLGRHHVLVPSVKSSWVTRLGEYASSAVSVQGRYNAETIQTLVSDSIDDLSIRGYPGRGFLARSATALAMDYRFPVLPIYRGWGTNPAYLTSLFGFAFAESTLFPASDPGAFALPSAGVGLRLASEVFFQLPLVFSVEYHHGFRQSQGGQGEAFFQLGTANFSF